MNRDPLFIRRRRMALGTGAAGLAVGVAGLVAFLGHGATTAGADGVGSRPTTSTSARPSTPSAKPTSRVKVSPTTTPAATRAPAAQDVPESATTRLVRTEQITGNLSSKSVVASGTGLVFAQNMMYQHTITVLSAEGKRLATIPDSVDLSAYGISGHPGISRGAPVEAAFSPDGKTAWISNYAMYGAGFLPEGRDACTGPGGASRSFLYAVDTTTYAIRAVVPVGTVPKFVAVTPDGKQVLVTNWCSMDLSIVDAATAKLVASVPVGGAHPRGIVVSPDSRTAYVAVMGSAKVVTVDLDTKDVSVLARTGSGPRHIDISPDGSTLYVTNNSSGTVSKVDRKTGTILRTVAVGSQPRSLAISKDGTAVFVVNYSSSTMMKIRTRDMRVLQTIPTDSLPIGITYEPTTHSVWVSAYSGSITIFSDTTPAQG